MYARVEQNGAERGGVGRKRGRSNQGRAGTQAVIEAHLADRGLRAIGKGGGQCARTCAVYGGRRATENERLRAVSGGAGNGVHRAAVHHANNIVLRIRKRDFASRNR